MDVVRLSVEAGFRDRMRPRVERSARSVRLAAALSCLVPLTLCVGCAFSRLKRDLHAVEENLGTIAGQVAGDSTGSYPVFVVVRATGSPDSNVLRHWPMYRPGAFRFALPAPGVYEVLAFEDRNGDFIYQEDEPASFSEKGPRILLIGGQRLEDLHISLREDSRVDLDFAVDLSSPAETVTLNDVTVSYGEITDIDDSRFTLANASMGMWEPLRFVREIGAGIFFLGPFDSGKTPVLFIHGLAGHPGQWGHLVESLDREHFQPWLLLYPSGARLRFLGDELYRMVERLHARYRFTDLHVVAHSMGGLVSRKFLNNVVTQGSPVRIGVFMTISTPWGGHGASELGVKYAPVVVPSWLDMLPGSAFQEGLWETPLPAGAAYYLLFSFRGENKPFMDRNNDGTVTLASELDMRAQRAAMRVCGLFEDHVSILSSENTSDLLAGALEQWRMGKATGSQASASTANAPVVHLE